MRTVGQIMKSPVITTKPGETARDLLNLSGQHHIRHFPVVENDQMLGLVTERNIREATVSPRAYGLLLDLLASIDQVLVNDIMVRDVVVASPEMSLREAAQLMVERRIGCLPVLREGKLVGIVTVVDLLGALLAGDMTEGEPPLAFTDGNGHGERGRSILAILTAP